MSRTELAATSRALASVAQPVWLLDFLTKRLAVARLESREKADRWKRPSPS